MNHTMKDNIKQSLQNPEKLEALYRENKSEFATAFSELYPAIQQEPAAQFWKQRLDYQKPPVLGRSSSTELWLLAGLSVLAALLIKIPDFTPLDADWYYPRNLGFTLIPLLMIYFAFKNKLAVVPATVLVLLTIACAIYINMLPGNDQSDSLQLAFMHLPFLLWSMAGYAFTGNQYSQYPRRISFLRYNGDLVVLSAIILIAGGILSAITIGLFELIGLYISDFYLNHIAKTGAIVTPLWATWLVQNNRNLVKNVSPVIARLFTPLVLVMLIAYLVSMIYTGKDPYNDREFLLIFNLLLIGVMAIILFATSEITGQGAVKLSRFVLLTLAVISMIINGIALSAIVFRISEWGITPNRLAVLGGNILILVHLISVSYGLFVSLRKPHEAAVVENRIAAYLPVYAAWAALVVFVFPLLFGFK